MDKEMVEKYIYNFRSDLYNFQCRTLYKEQLIKQHKIEENYYIDSFYYNSNNKYDLLTTLDYKICPIYSWKALHMSKCSICK
jgi:hypothetical protein